MTVIRRRGVLGGMTAGLASAVLPRAGQAESPALKPPVARVQPVQDHHFGDTLTDPYRWMENPHAPEFLAWMKAQNAYTRAILDRLPDRAALLERIGQLSGDSIAFARAQQTAGPLFYQKRPLHADNFKLYVRDQHGHDRVLVDPTTIRIAGASHVSLDWWQASPRGTYVAYGLSPNGSEDSVLHVLRTADGADLPERIADTENANPQWLDDESGFFYTQLTGKVGTPDRYLDARARFHRLGADPSADPVLMQRGRNPAVVYDRIQAPTILTSAGSDHAVLSLADVRSEMRLYVATVTDAASGHAAWVEVTRFEDEVTDFTMHGHDILLLVNHGTPLGRVVAIPVAKPDLAQARTLVPQGRDVIEAIDQAQDGLYLKVMDGGLGRLRRLDGAHLSEVTLPFDATIIELVVNPERPGALVHLSGWLSPAGFWRVSPAGALTRTDLMATLPVDVGPYVATRGFATVRDGTRVPYTVIHRKDLHRDGRNRAFISAYGSYGLTAYTPEFVGRDLALVDRGAVVGFVGVRGGGEYGRPWHRAGQLQNKPNTWRDLIDTCEALCHLGYTAPAHLAIGGRSAGGITVGRAMTERPDLFAAVIDGVGWSNPLRYVVEQNGVGEEPEWGAIGDPAGYRALKAIDSYQAVRDHTPYPAVLLTTGITDPRVAPFHVAKMTARLQAATSSGKPILLRVDYDAGHGIGSTRGQQDREAADTYAFLLWQT